MEEIIMKQTFKKITASIAILILLGIQIGIGYSIGFRLAPIFMQNLNFFWFIAAVFSFIVHIGCWIPCMLLEFELVKMYFNMPNRIDKFFQT